MWKVPKKLVSEQIQASEGVFHVIECIRNIPNRQVPIPKINSEHSSDRCGYSVC